MDMMSQQVFKKFKTSIEWANALLTVRPYGTNNRGRYVRGRSTVRGNFFRGRGRGFIHRGRGTSNSHQSGPQKPYRQAPGIRKRAHK